MIKKNIPIFTRLLCVLFAVVVTISAEDRNLAVVLSGGGARGLAQIGVLKALDDQSIHPDLIVGTSMGAIIGAFYACGYSADSIASIARSIDWNSVFANSAVRQKLFVIQKDEPINYLFELRFDDQFKPIIPNSISYGQMFYDVLAPRLAPAQFRASGNFDSLPIPLRIIATDIIAGKKVTFSHGNIVTAIRASCGVPLAFSPVELDSMMLMDGGLSANIPVETAREEHSKNVIAVDVTSPEWKKNDLVNPVRLVDQIVSIGIRKQKEKEKTLADIVIKPALAGYSNTDYSHIDSLISLGYKATMAMMDSIKDLQLISSDNSASSDTSAIRWEGVDTPLVNVLRVVSLTSAGSKKTVSYRRQRINSMLDLNRKSFSRVIYSDPDSLSIMKAYIIEGKIKGISITGNNLTSRRIIEIVSGLRTGDTLTGSRLQKGIVSLYSSGLFENVNMDFDTSGVLRILVQEKEYWRARMGLRFDEFHLGEGFIEPAYENLFGQAICASLHLQYGLRREKYALEFQSRHSLTSNFAYSLQLQAYLSKEGIVQREIVIRDTLPDSLALQELILRKSGIILLAGTQIGKFAMLSAGINMERFNMQMSDRSVFGDVLGLRFREGLPYLMMRLTVDNMDKFPFPTTGQKHYFTIGGSHRFVGGEVDFLKVNGSFGRYFTLYRLHTFFPQIRFTWSSDTLPRVEQVYLGGMIPEERYRDMSLYNYVPFYGLKPRALPGDIMALFHLDYRFMVRRNFYITTGGDWGYTWKWDIFKPNEAVREFLRNAPIGLGIGVIYESPAGPVRFSYGKLVHDYHRLGIASENLFYFSAGHDF